MNTEFMSILEDIEKEKGVSHELLVTAIEQALVSAYKKNYSARQNIVVHIDRMTGEMKVYKRRTVVAEAMDEESEISLEEAKKINPVYEEGDFVDTETMPAAFGRIAAQTARQVIVQRLREAERIMIYEQFSDRQGDIVSCVINRVERRNVFVTIEKTEAILVTGEQVPGETYRIGDRLKVYVVEVSKTTKGPQVMISRSHPGLVKRLFELEVPEIQSGLIEIKGIAREAGTRTKLAVHSTNENIDASGACIGPKGIRVQNIVNELKGEKIDIVKFSEDPAEFVAAALSPAKIEEITVDEEEKVCRVLVEGKQLSLAIGKEGQNARLAAKLTGWKVDIKSCD